MRFHPSDSDISTLYNRIKEGDYDLQPDFQRGEVWTKQKQQRLVDTILRRWVVPPILIVPGEPGGPQLVLDGQQRLATIRDFKEDTFPVDGSIQPRDVTIESLHGKKYSQLPPEIQKAFDKATLRVYEITDFRPDEPAEIFFRLNQPTPLTEAEKRNALIGPVRSQVRALANRCITTPEIQSLLAFSNARMAYDEVLARFCCLAEQNSLWRKVTTAAINDMYRREQPLSPRAESTTDTALARFSELARDLAEFAPNAPLKTRLNKATFLSWLLFLARMKPWRESRPVAEFFLHFELGRAGLGANKNTLHSQETNETEVADGSRTGSVAMSFVFDPSAILLRSYSDRSTSRVADVSSVVLRDLALWASWADFFRGNDLRCSDGAYESISSYKDALLSTENEWDLASDEILLKFADRINWGKEL